MMKRVGQRRLKVKEREVTIVHAIARLKYEYDKPATLHSIAYMIGMTPSTHLQRMLSAMADVGKISRHYHINGRRQNVARYDVEPMEKQWCTIPWKCDSLCVIHDTGKVCVGKLHRRAERA